MRYWLMKSEPSVFSIDDLARAPKQTTSWDGVRNYQARNLLREAAVGDGVIFYHSSADPHAAALDFARSAFRHACAACAAVQDRKGHGEERTCRQARRGQNW